MTTQYKTQGFIFKKSNLNESDRIFSVFTENFGRVELYAKAIRKSISKLRSGIDIFFLSDVEFIQGKTKKTLIDSSIIDNFGNFYKNPEKFMIASNISQVLDDFLRGTEKDENIFNLIKDTFNKLNNYELKIASHGLLYFYFLWNFLSLLGYRPEVEKCATCLQKLSPYDIYFSDKLGGAICQKCLTHDNKASKINSDIIKIIRLIFKNDWGTLSKLKIPQDSQKLFKSVSINYYSFLLSK